MAEIIVSSGRLPRIDSIENVPLAVHAHNMLTFSSDSLIESTRIKTMRHLNTVIFGRTFGTIPDHTLEERIRFLRRTDVIA